MLAEPERLRVVAASAPGARDAADVSRATGLDARSVEAAPRGSRAPGLVGGVPSALVPHEELLERAGRVARPPEDPFVRDGRLGELPVRRGRRRAVLEQVSGEVDHVTARRHLVDEGLLSRADGECRRSGGPVDV